MASDEKGRGERRTAKGKGKGMTVALIDAVSHQLRREILRRMNGAKGARSATQLSKVLDEEVPTISYHLEVLAKQRAISKARSKRVRGARETFFVSKVATNKRLVDVLADTEQEDRGTRR